MIFERFDSKVRFEREIFNDLSLFCGAGFSVLSKDTNGDCLPTGPELLNEIKAKFNEVTGNYNKLEAIASALNRGLDRQKFKDFLTERFTVGTDSDCYDKYNSLAALNIKNIFTTNIDNLCDRIFSSSNASNPSIKTINNALQKGISYNVGMINYYPLHGCVLTKQEDYIFAKRELATAYSQSGLKSGWNEFQNIVADKPILFWGWNFADYDVVHAMYAQDFQKNMRKWAILFTDGTHKPSDDDIEQLEADNFNIIFSNTRDFLLYLDALTASRESPVQTKENVYSSQLNDYLPPKRESLVAMPFDRFFTDYYPDWYHIYHENIVKTHWFKSARDIISEDKNLLLSGIPGCGKTTLLRQLLVECSENQYNNTKPVHYMEQPSVDDVKRYVTVLNGQSSLLFVDDALRDAYALQKLFNIRNIQVIATTRDYNYERQNYRLPAHRYELRDITLLTEEDVVNIADSIPRNLKNNAWKEITERSVRKNLDLTMVSVFPQVTKGIHNFNFINKFYNEDPDAARVFCLVCYASACRTVVSFDMVYSFLSDSRYNYKEMFDIIHRSGALIIGKTVSPNLISRHGDMDYYDCRSSFLANKILESTISNRKIFSDVLWDFTEKINISKICKYDLFRQNGYDSKWALRAFCTKVNKEYKENEQGKGESYYEMCRLSDDSEYIYQHAALYLAALKQYEKAYDWINRAKNVSRFDRFSIQNTEAQIRFDANYTKHNAEDMLMESLEIMHASCISDKRGHIHISKFAEYSLKFYDKTNGVDEYLKSALIYLENAHKYILDVLYEKNEAKTRISYGTNQRLKQNRLEIENILSKHNVSIMGKS